MPLNMYGSLTPKLTVGERGWLHSYEAIKPIVLLFLTHIHVLMNAVLLYNN